jgi:hypothetical protein
MQENIGTHAKKRRDIRKQDIGIDAKKHRDRCTDR